MYRSRFRFFLALVLKFASMASLSLLGWLPVGRSGAGARFFFLCRSNPWWRACKTKEDQGRFNKTACRTSCFANRELIHLLLAGRGGGGKKWCFCSSKWFLLHPRAPHAVSLVAAVIHDQKDGRISTSTAEAFSFQRQRSAARCHQVVRPRWHLACWWLRTLVGREQPSKRCSDDLGVGAWRSPASCGRGSQGLDCFLSFSSRVLFVNLKGLSSNIRSSRARFAKGLFVKCTCHLVI